MLVTSQVPSMVTIKNNETSNTEIPLFVCASPHIKSKSSISSIMWQINASLIPIVIFAVLNFGIHALVTILVSITGAIVTEALVLWWQKKRITVYDGSAVLTGLLLALCLPARIPWYMPLCGSIMALGVAKHMMGGLGNNVFNPAHVGRAFLLASYPVAMTTFTVPKFSSINFKHLPYLLSTTDATSSATPLGILKLDGYESLLSHFGGKAELYTALLFGNHAGSLGETSAILILICGAVLIFRGLVGWHIPLAMIGTVGILAWIFGGHDRLFCGDPLFHILAGGVLIGAFFMATDPVTAPMTKKGQVVFACGAGILTMLIRLAGGYPEGVCYAILLMNAVTPIIDKFFFPQKFGSRSQLSRYRIQSGL